MSDFVIRDGDIASFLPAFTPAVVTVQPGTITGSGPAKAAGKLICIEGDESSVEVSGCPYVAPPYVIPGTGTLTIDSLASNQVATKTKAGGTYVLLKGATFTAKFEVQSPAQQPGSPPTPDATTSYSGQGSFITTNTKVKAT